MVYALLLRDVMLALVPLSQKFTQFVMPVD